MEVQQPDFAEEEMEYLVMTGQESYTQMEQVQKRIVELLSYRRNRQAYRKRTEIAVDHCEDDRGGRPFPTANYAFDNGVLTLDLTRLIERA